MLACLLPLDRTTLLNRTTCVGSTCMDSSTPACAFIRHYTSLVRRVRVKPRDTSFRADEVTTVLAPHIIGVSGQDFVVFKWRLATLMSRPAFAAFLFSERVRATSGGRHSRDSSRTR